MLRIHLPVARGNIDANCISCNSAHCLFFRDASVLLSLVLELLLFGETKLLDFLLLNDLSAMSYIPRPAFTTKACVAKVGPSNRTPLRDIKSCSGRH